MHRVSGPPRGPRNGSPALRTGVTAGGIQKRGRLGQSPRIDRDGDLVMDPAAAEKRRVGGRGRLDSPKPLTNGRGNGGPVRGGPPRGPRQGGRNPAGIVRGMNRQPNMMDTRPRLTATLEVYGLAQSKAATNPDGGLQSLLEFIQRKANAKSTKAIKIKKSQIKSDSLVMITASPEDIMTIETLEGFVFAGSPLTFKPIGPLASDILKALDAKMEVTTAPSKTAETKEKLKGILASRYNGELKLLNLSDLANDVGLKEMGVFDGTTTTSKIFPALMAICDGLFESRKAKLDAVLSVTLADNGLTTISDVFALSSTFPDLKNLDLSRNNLADLRSIDGWKYKFRSLENLMLIGNPIEQQLSTLKDEILKRYPKLQILNNVQLRTAEDIAAARAAMKARPLAIPIQEPSFRDVGQVGENFIRHFLPLYDSNRAQLASTYYDAESVASISINMVAPHEKGPGSGAIPQWHPYTPHSRNMTKVTHLPARMGRQKRGLQQIQELWASLPATHHPDLQTSSDKYLIECNPVPGLPDLSGVNPGGVDGLMLTIHGEFEEPPPTPTASTDRAMRSFSRTFILGPGAPGNNPIRVISDMMVLRAWSPVARPVAMIAQPQIQAPLPSNTLPPPQQMMSAPIQITDQQRQEAMAMQLVEKSGMTLEYSVLCLTETGWNFDQAFMAFTANRDKLPAEAWIAR